MQSVMGRAEVFEFTVFNLMHFVPVISHQPYLANDSKSIAETELHGRPAIDIWGVISAKTSSSFYLVLKSFA